MLLPFRSFARERRISQSLADSVTNGQIEAVSVGDWILASAAIVESEFLLVKISKQVERFHAHIRAINAALEQAPEIFQPVCMYATVHVLNRVIYDLMRVFGFQPS